jgi:hypothetical protein
VQKHFRDTAKSGKTITPTKAIIKRARHLCVCVRVCVCACVRVRRVLSVGCLCRDCTCRGGQGRGLQGPVQGRTVDAGAALPSRPPFTLRWCSLYVSCVSCVSCVMCRVCRVVSCVSCGAPRRKRIFVGSTT